jgi:hypothetical protein
MPQRGGLCRQAKLDLIYSGSIDIPASRDQPGTRTFTFSDRGIGISAHPDDRNNFIVFLKESEVKKSLSGRSEFRYLTKSGEIKRAALFIIKITHEENPGLLFIIEDLSEPSRLKEKLEKDNERRRGIIGTVAHELRTPLQPIMGYLNLLTQDPQIYGLNEETKQILKEITQFLTVRVHIIFIPAIYYATPIFNFFSYVIPPIFLLQCISSLC